MGLKEYTEEKVAQGKSLSEGKDAERDNLLYKLELSNSSERSEYVLKVLPPSRAGDFANSPEHHLYGLVGEDWRQHHVLTPLAYWQDPKSGELFLFMPFVEGRTLEDVWLELEKLDPSPEKTQKKIELTKAFTLDAGQAFQTLREAGVLHNELIARHFLIDTSAEVFMFNLESMRDRKTSATQDLVSHEVYFFQTVGELLYEGPSLSKLDELLSTMHSGLVSNLDDPRIQALLQSMADKVGMTPAEALAKYKSFIEAYQLAELDGIIRTSELVRLAWICHFLGERYGEPVVDSFVEGLKSSLLDENWSFAVFSKEFVEML